MATRSSKNGKVRNKVPANVEYVAAEWTDPQTSEVVTGLVERQNATSIYVRWTPQNRLERIPRRDVGDVVFKQATDLDPCADQAALDAEFAIWKTAKHTATLAQLAAAESHADATLGTRSGLTIGCRNVLWFRLVNAELSGSSVDLAEAHLAAARRAAQEAQERYMDAVRTGHYEDAPDTGEANVDVERAELALDIAAGQVAPGTVRFYRIDSTQRISWGRMDALPGETADEQALRRAVEGGITGELMSANRWQVRVWTDPRPGAKPDGYWSRTAVHANDLRDYMKEEGPVEVATPDGWRPLVSATHELYNRVAVTVTTNTGSWGYLWNGDHTVDVRPFAEAPANPAHIPPVLGESRVVYAGWLPRYVGWEWFNYDGQWEPITGAKKGRHGADLVVTPSAPEGCYLPTAFAIIRPTTDPTERLRADQLPEDCTCQTWQAGPFTADGRTPLARYPSANCPTRHAPTPKGLSPLAMPSHIVDYLVETETETGWETTETGHGPVRRATRECLAAFVDTVASNRRGPRPSRVSGTIRGTVFVSTTQVDALVSPTASSSRRASPHLVSPGAASPAVTAVA